MKELLEKYETEQKRIEREISDLWEVGKKSKAKEKRLEEIKLILIGIEAKQIIEDKIRENNYYKTLLDRNNISYLK